MATRIDGLNLLYTYLTGITALTTETDSRIYGTGGGIPPGISEPLKMITIASDGGPGDPDIPMAMQRFTFSCYGPTLEDAHSVFTVLFDALHRLGRHEVTISGSDVGLLQWAELEMGPADVPEPELGWPRVVCAYRVIFYERLKSW